MLDLNQEEMRELGYRAVDSIVEHFSTVRQKPVAQKATDEFIASLEGNAPDHPSDPMALISDLESTVFSQTIHIDHPRFFAFVPGPSNFISVIAQLLAAGHNTFCGSWLAGSAAIEMELQVLRWLCQICGLPKTWSGLTTSGGSNSNLIALATARHVAGATSGNSVVYYSDQTHYSVSRALKIIGYTPEQTRELPSVGGVLDGNVLQRAVEADLASGMKPGIVVANAGTTNTGAVDPLGDLADIAEQHDMWLHIDAAYGGPAAATSQGGTLLADLKRGHSITLDPHKWLFQPLGCACVMVKDPDWLEQMFRAAPAYLQDVHGLKQVNMCDRGIELSRPFRVLGLWMTIKAFGLQKILDAIQKGVDNAEWIQSRLESRPERWEIVTPAQLGVITFRYRDERLTAERSEALHQALVPLLMQDGYAMYSRTTIGNRTVCRLCTINPRATQEDLSGTIERIEQIAGEWLEGSVSD